MISGMTVTLWTKSQIGTDGFNRPIYDWTSENVENVLVGSPTPQEMTDQLNLDGRRIEFILGIPKGDSHNWENQIVEFFGHKFKTIGIPEEGIEENIPRQLPWHKKVKCERYE